MLVTIGPQSFRHSSRDDDQARSGPFSNDRSARVGHSFTMQPATKAVGGLCERLKIPVQALL